MTPNIYIPATVRNRVISHHVGNYGPRAGKRLRCELDCGHVVDMPPHYQIADDGHMKCSVCTHGVKAGRCDPHQRIHYDTTRRHVT